MNEFKDKTILITGGTSGIGEATALAFAKFGACVAITGRRVKEGAKVCEKINAAGGQSLFVQGDVSKEEDVKLTVKNVLNKFGRIDFLFANAGVWGNPRPILEETKENIDLVIDINLKGVLYTIKHVAPEIIKNGGGAIVTNSSILGIRAMADSVVYNASKFAVVGITRTAALELSSKNIRVNCIAPGPIETDMLSIACGGNVHALDSLTPMQRIGQPHEIAESVIWLCSKNSSYVNGQIIAVDGGYTAG